MSGTGALEIGLVVGDDGHTRCFWGAGADPLYTRYHDEEWGRPVVDDTQLFEKLCLEGFQAGLSWLTILRKREAFRSAFAGFDPAAIASFDDSDVETLLADGGIVRHRGKITSTINNARRVLELRDEFDSLAGYVWSFEPADEHQPLGRADLHPTSSESIRLGKDLKRRGWSFVGPTTVYAFMQAMGLVNDHIVGCWVRGECETERARLVRPQVPGP